MYRANLVGDIHLAGSRWVITRYGEMPCRCSNFRRAWTLRLPCAITRHRPRR